MDIRTKGLIFAIRAHGDQKRKFNNEPYIVHPIRVEARLKWLNDDIVSIAAWNHDVLEDTSVTEQQMRDALGNDVTNLVLEVTKVSKPEDGNRAFRKEKDLRYLSTIGNKAKVLKAADILDNTSNITELDNNPEYAKMFLQEKWDVSKVLKPDVEYPTDLYQEMQWQIMKAASRFNYQLVY